MKKKLFAALIISGLFLSTNSYAQSWAWGRGNAIVSIISLESWPVATDHAGNVFAAGINNSHAPSVFNTDTIPYSVDPGDPLGYQCIIVKYDASGNFLWGRGTENGDALLLGIATDAGGNSYLLGSMTSDSIKIGPITLTSTIYPDYYEYFLVKFDPSGNVLWAKKGGETDLLVGYIGILGSGGIATDAASNIYITSNYQAPTVTVGTYTLTNTDPSGMTDDILVAKYDSLGNVIWATSSGGPDNDEAYSLTVTQAGNVYISGIFRSPTIAFGPSTITDSSGGVGNAFIARYNASGSPVWACTSGGTGGESASAVVADAANNVYLTGGVSDPEISFSGTSITNSYAPGSALFLVKFDTSNNVSWYKTIGSPVGSSDVRGYSIAMSPCNDIWVSGPFSKEVSIDGHILDTVAGSVTAGGPAGSVGDPVFIAGFTTGGAYTLAAALQSGGDDQNGIACGPSGDVYMCGDYGTVPFIVGSDTFPPCPFGESQFVAKYKLPAIAADTTYRHTDTFGCDILLHAPAGYAYYLWDNGSTNTTLSADTPGTYWVIGFSPCGTSVMIDTFLVKTRSTDTTFMHQDTAVCKGAAISLTAPWHYSHYLWNNNTTADSLGIDTTGTYWVIGFSTCDTILSIDTFKVADKNVDLSFSLGPDTTICSPMTLTVPLPGITYLWQNGSTENSYTVTQSGTYYVTVSEQGCFNSDTINVSYPDISQHLNDTLFCRETFSQYTLYANLPPGATALWSTGSAAPSITVKDTGTYWVTVTDAACTGSDSMVLSTELCDCTAFLPTAFTPNDDGRNDTYRPVFENGCVITGYSFSIYNRWGQQVFYSENPNDKWDGMFFGTKAEMGTYMYYLKYTSGLYHTPYALKGDITLIR